MYKSYILPCLCHKGHYSILYAVVRHLLNYPNCFAKTPSGIINGFIIQQAPKGVQTFLEKKKLNKKNTPLSTGWNVIVMSALNDLLTKICQQKTAPVSLHWPQSSLPRSIDKLPTVLTGFLEVINSCRKFDG